MPVTAKAATDYFAGGHIQGREQRGRAVPGVVMRPPFGLPRLHRQQGLRAVQGLDLAFLVDAEHDRSVRRVHVQADDVPDLLDAERVLGKLERLGAVGLQPERTPDPTDGGLGHAGGLGHPPCTPVGGSLGLGLERFRDDLLDIRVSDLTWGTRPFLVSESVDPSLDEPAAPLADGLGGDAELGGNPFVVETVGAGQDDPGGWASCWVLLGRDAQVFKVCLSSSFRINSALRRPSGMVKLL